MDIRAIFAIGFCLLLLGCASQQPSSPSQIGANESGNSGVISMNTTNKTAAAEIAVLETNMGTIEIELNRKKAPVTVENFVQYVKSGQYDGTIFHRVIDGFMIQGGGFTPDGKEKGVRAPIKLESANGLKNAVGAIAMARTNDPDSATSQFFINVADNAFLNYAPGNPGYAVFGTIVSGMDAVNKIKGVQTTTKGYNENWPVQDVIIQKAYMK